MCILQNSEPEIMMDDNIKLLKKDTESANSTEVDSDKPEETEVKHAVHHETEEGHVSMLGPHGDSLPANSRLRQAEEGKFKE